MLALTLSHYLLLSEADHGEREREKEWQRLIISTSWEGSEKTRVGLDIFSLRRVYRRAPGYINISVRNYSRELEEINSSNSTAHKPEVEIYIRRLCFPSPSLVNSLHGILRYLLHMLPSALRFRVFKESAAGLFSSFLHLMDFISRHFLTTTQWSSSASISQFSSVNCQVTVPRKLAIIFSLISRNIFKEWQVKTDLLRRLKENTQTSCQQKCENIYEIFSFCPRSDRLTSCLAWTL